MIKSTQLAVIASLFFLVGCSTIKEAETAKEDVDKAILILERDVEPRLLKFQKLIETVEEDYIKDKKEAQLFWVAEVEPRLLRLEKISGAVESDLSRDVKKTTELWRNDIEPRLARLEKLVVGIERDTVGKLHHDVVMWHKSLESHLYDLEHPSQISKDDKRKTFLYLKNLKVDLRSIKVQAMSEGKNEQSNKSINRLIAHLESLDSKPIAELTKDDIAESRAEIEQDVAETLKYL